MLYLVFTLFNYLYVPVDDDKIVLTVNKKTIVRNLSDNGFLKIFYLLFNNRIAC